MLKLLIALVFALLAGVMVLQLRQQRLELNYQINQLHRQIEASQSRLWSQQVQIASYTAPNAIFRVVSAEDLKMVPQNAPPQSKIDPHATREGFDPDAE